ncbi:hypothetical protein FHS29_006290 [Saccharothrix tamanrassetensis]|uniref:Uncharacterized protein n=1 Tax=Saccharothrix tamanrassetensis TaxID=1051531 RepID=A0A841CQU7_9PSEU|nr:hypothetical protein [Saccharothrix tamanrassetensis]MBB5959669.1 hypothetical protein [Saccharothrix tamanrassetensis]
MRIPFVRTTLAAAALLAVAVTPARSSTEPAKDELPGLAYESEYYERVLAEEAASAPVFEVAPEVTAAKKSIQARVQAFVDANGTRYTFATSSDPTLGKVVLVTDAPRDVVSGLVGADAEHVNVIGNGVTDTSRKYDTAPFWGGAGLKFPGEVPCSSGYVVQDGAAKRYMVTVAHCYHVVNQSVWVEQAPAFAQNVPEHVGWVLKQGLATGHDIALIGGKTYTGRIYSGGTNSTTSRAVATASDPLENVWTYCHSGRTTGEQCGHGVVDLDAQFCSSSGCKQPVAKFKGGTLNDGGDSGAPFYSRFADGSVAIRGHVIGRDFGVDQAGYAEKYSRVKAKYGVSIVPGA